MRRVRGPVAMAVGAVAGLTVAAGAAAAVQVPAATTGAASRITSQSATVAGRVNPHGPSTTSSFQYGTTAAYGAQTPAAGVGAGTSAVPVTAVLAGLAPSTTYHYRLVAQNASGTARGADRTFRTPAVPLGLALGAAPNPVAFAGPATMTGTLSGTGNAGRTIQVQQNPFPFSAGFANAGNAVVTDAQGRFSVALLTVPLTTQYRAVVVGRPSIASPVVTVGVRSLVRTRVTRTRVRRGGRVHLSGTVRPAEVGRPMAVQKLRNGRWVTVAGMLVRHGGTGFGLYGKTIRIAHGGDYRVFLGTGTGATLPGAGRTVRIHTV